MMRLTKGLVLILVLGVLSACGVDRSSERLIGAEGSSEVAAPDRATAYAARDWARGVKCSTYAPPARPDPELVQLAEAAIVFHVEAIGQPFFNSSDGRVWKGKRSDTGGSIGVDVYSTVTGTVEEVWWGEWETGVLKLLVTGDATRRWEEDEIPPFVHGSGGFVEGERFVLLVHRFAFRFEGGEQEWPTVTEGFGGNWRIDGDRAVGSYRAQTAPLSVLRHGLVTAFEAREGRGVGERPEESGAGAGPDGSGPAGGPP